MININNLNFGYSKHKPLFKNMSMRLSNGHIYGLLGKNGAGKSSLLKNLAGLVYAQSGTLDVMGYNPAKRQPALLEQIFAFSKNRCLSKSKRSVLQKFRS
jgi:ABC-2 type transport system ATP-binding protein